MSQDHVLGFVTGTLELDRRVAIEGHLDVCAECLELVTLLGQTSVARGSETDAAADDATAEADCSALVAVDPQHYVLGPEIARGGIGRIRAARDRRHGRPVAVKELLVASPALRARFEREARITARLQHPSIVSLIEAGTWPSGEPFYAMRLVTGESLDRAIARRATLPSRLSLLPNVIAAVDALSYAHSQRVIHRDLKPANVLVGEFGETVVIDWGFATDLAGAAEPTDAGVVMGTPAYMPPEQAHGLAVDERSDVFALGALLHHVLAGAPPPSPLPARTPPELVAIVRRAMAYEPADRYATATQLADDLKQFQTGQLVAAHRYSTWQLVRRIVRRHRAPLAVAAIALVSLGAFAVASVRGIVREEARTEAQRRVAEQHRRDAEDLLAFMLVDLRDKLKPLNRLDVLDDVATRAITYYDRRGDAVTVTELGASALARRNLGDVLAARGGLDDAIAQYRAALAIATRAAAAEPTNLDGAREVAVAHERLGNQVRARGDTTAALRAQRAALAIREALVVADPTNDAFQADLAVSHDKIGALGIAQGDPDAVAHYHVSLALREALAARAPGDADRQRDLAVSHDELGTALVDAGDATGALAEYEALLAVTEGLAARDPDNAQWQQDLAVAHSKIGDTLYDRDVPQALARYRAGLAILARLAAADPANADRQAFLSFAHYNVGDALLRIRRPDAALEHYRAALAISDTLAARDPTSADLQRDLSVSRAKIGDALLARGDGAGALAAYRASLAIRERLVALDPTNASRREDLLRGHTHVAAALAERGDRTGSLAEYRAALAIAQELASANPTNATVRSMADELAALVVRGPTVPARPR